MSVAPNYVHRITYTYRKNLVTPGTQMETIVKPAGLYTVKIVIFEWYQPSRLNSLIAAEFPANAGWTYTVSQPSKPEEGIDLINGSITGRKRIA